MTNITDPRIHRKPIIWDDIEFATSPTECIRAHAYHKQELCAKLGGTSPGIHRYRTYVNGTKVCSAVVCDGCRVSVAKVARRQLEKLDKNVVEMSFGPLTQNIRTDYYIPIRTDYYIPVPFFTGEKKNDG